MGLSTSLLICIRVITQRYERKNLPSQNNTYSRDYNSDLSSLVQCLSGSIIIRIVWNFSPCFHPLFQQVLVLDQEDVRAEAEDPVLLGLEGPLRDADEADPLVKHVGVVLGVDRRDVNSLRCRENRDYCAEDTFS